MKSRELARFIRSALLVAVLLLAQAAVAAHFDIDDSHPAGESCALCAGSSVLGAGNVAAVAAFEFVTSFVELEPYAQSAAPRFHASHYLARGPPAAS